MNILEVEQVKKYYATQKAVDDVSFTLSRGSIFGLLGPNGAGKTTLIRMITGIFYPDAGNIILNGNKFNPDKDLMQIGYMPEERGLYKKMKTGEQVVYLAQLKGSAGMMRFIKQKNGSPAWKWKPGGTVKWKISARVWDKSCNLL
jgi:ABC-2 type transport system ATP-binding protein